MSEPADREGMFTVVDIARLFDVPSDLIDGVGDAEIAMAQWRETETLLDTWELEGGDAARWAPETRKNPDEVSIRCYLVLEDWQWTYLEWSAPSNCWRTPSSAYERTLEAELREHRS